ncbi:MULTISPECIES: non-heme ferritin [Shewanella]|uniref:Ferritin n=2 Tax=Shewanella TaxID=22 RepID=A0AAJ1BJX4_9GAMM|nr:MULTISPECIES: non-heme ferritin [Shewanella]AZQ12871.1 putative ferritin-1 [Shewanella khirikhana]MCH4296023.1 non-heme ferritin [Shewanella zhuhaiensis]
MLAATMIDKLNEQINLEFFSSNLYLQMSAWCEDKGFEGAAHFMRAHADEEMGHMRRLFTYVSETGGLPLIGTIEAPRADFTSLLSLFEYTYEHEQTITRKINELAHAAFTSHDYSTFHFLQWYVAEQHEEEKLFKSIVDKIRLVGEDGKALFFIDKDLEMLATKEAESIMKPAAV